MVRIVLFTLFLGFSALSTIWELSASGAEPGGQPNGQSAPTGDTGLGIDPWG